MAQANVVPPVFVVFAQDSSSVGVWGEEVRQREVLSALIMDSVLDLLGVEHAAAADTDVSSIAALSARVRTLEESALATRDRNEEKHDPGRAHHAAVHLENHAHKPEDEDLQAIFNWEETPSDDNKQTAGTVAVHRRGALACMRAYAVSVVTWHSTWRAQRALPRCRIGCGSVWGGPIPPTQADSFWLWASRVLHRDVISVHGVNRLVDKVLTHQASILRVHA